MNNCLSAWLMAAAVEAAPGTQPQPGGLAQGFASFMPIILMFVIMYLLLIRPQQKKAKEHRELLSQLKTGDAVVTNGGIYGVISGVKDRTLMLKIAPNVEVEVARAAVAGLRDREPAD